jgi:hypothetical protein
VNVENRQKRRCQENQGYRPVENQGKSADQNQGQDILEQLFSLGGFFLKMPQKDVSHQKQDAD